MRDCKAVPHFKPRTVYVVSNQLKDKNDIKIFILFLLSHIGYPLDFVSINDIVVQDGYVGYFDFAECFAQLLETGNVAELKENGQEMYLITEQGIRVAESLDSRLINMIKDKSLKRALRLLSFKERGAKLFFDYRPLPNGRFEVECAINEKDECPMSVKLTLESINQLEKIRRNFYDKPETVYRGILAVMTGEVNYLIE